MRGASDVSPESSHHVLDRGPATHQSGGKSRLVCPADLAYGDRGSPPKIKPGATLIFEVALLDIVK
ncbi:FKBP-type peptidyl-prolyl cis-trans isomerase [Nitrospira calida]